MPIAGLQDAQHAPCVTGRAATLDAFGGAEHLRIREHRWRSAIAADEVLIRNLATSINPIEWKMREGHGLPLAVWRRLLGEPIILGLDFAGEVVAAGRVSGFEPGERVMGALPLNGAHADYVRVRPAGRGAIARLPGGVTPDVAALLPFSGLVALAGLSEPSLDGGCVLIIGATGGVGHLALQIARALGARRVSAICSGRNSDFARRLGADDVVPHDALRSTEDIVRLKPAWRGAFDLIFDASGMDDYYTCVAPALLSEQGRFVAIALPTLPDGRPGEAARPIEAVAIAGRIARRRLSGRYRLVAGLLGAIGGNAELETLARWLAAGQVVPHLGAHFALANIADAHRLSETGGTLGKIAISLTSEVERATAHE